MLGVLFGYIKMPEGESKLENINQFSAGELVRDFFTDDSDEFIDRAVQFNLCLLYTSDAADEL